MTGRHVVDVDREKQVKAELAGKQHTEDAGPATALVGEAGRDGSDRGRPDQQHGQIWCAAPADLVPQRSQLCRHERKCR